MKIKTIEYLVLTQEEHELLTETRKLVHHIYENTGASKELENITFQLVSALDDLLEYENLEVE